MGTSFIRAMLLASVSVTAAVGVTPTAAHAQEQSYDINIPAQSLGDAIRALGRSTRQNIVFDGATVRGKRSVAVRGNMTPAEALDRMLSGSGLVMAKSASGSLTVRMGNGQGGAELASSNGEDGADADAGSDVVFSEIIVTAQKRTERLRDVPVPASVLQGQKLADAGQLRVQDYYSQVPGLSVAIYGNGGEPVLSIRGINTGGDTNPTTAVLIDDVPYGSSVATGGATPPIADIDPSDLARIEVLRGPQGTLYGASAMGGLLKFVTRDPSADAFSGRVQAGLSTIDDSNQFGYSLRGSLNAPLSGEAALRVSAFTLRDPGYVDNAETGEKDVNSRRSTGGRATFLWHPTSAFSLRLTAMHQVTDRHGTEDVDVTLGRRNPRQSFLVGTGAYKRRTDQLSATAAGVLGAVDWVSVTGYSRDKIDDNLDITTAAGGFLSDVAFENFGVRRVNTISQNDVNKFSEEVRLTAHLGQSVDWLVGGFYTHESTFRFADNIAENDEGEAFGSIYGNVYDKAKLRELAGFTNLTVRLSPRFDVQGGLRYSSIKQSLPLTFTGPLATQFFCPETGAPCIQPTLNSKGSAVTYLITPRYRPNDDMMIYARIASGYRPGGPNAQCGFPGVPCNFDPDRTVNYEVGVKGSLLGRRLGYDASIYYIDWKDLQISGILTPDGFFDYTGNVSGASSKGVEVSADYRTPGELTIAGWVSYNDAKLTEDLPSGVNFVAFKGDRLPYSTKWSANLSVEQGFTIGRGKAFVGGSVIYVGKRYGNFQPGPDREVFPSYTQLNLRSGYRWNAWEFNLYLNNVTNEHGVLRGGLDAALSPTYFTFIAPRTVGANVGYRF